MANGAPLKDALDSRGVTVTQWYRLVVNDPEAAKAVDLARSASAMAAGFAVRDLAHEIACGTVPAFAAGTAARWLAWTAERGAPDHWGPPGGRQAADDGGPGLGEDEAVQLLTDASDLAE